MAFLDSQFFYLFKLKLTFLIKFWFFFQFTRWWKVFCDDSYFSAACYIFWIFSVLKFNFSWSLYTLWFMLALWSIVKFKVCEKKLIAHNSLARAHRGLLWSTINFQFFHLSGVKIAFFWLFFGKLSSICAIVIILSWMLHYFDLS